jgi:hypothetical protein
MNDQPSPDLLREGVPELDHFLELIRGIDVQQRKWQRARVKRLLGQPDHHAGVLPDRIEHYRALEFSDHFTKNVDTFGLQGAKVGEGTIGHAVPKTILSARCDTFDSE